MKLYMPINTIFVLICTPAISIDVKIDGWQLQFNQLLTFDMYSRSITSHSHTASNTGGSELSFE